MFAGTSGGQFQFLDTSGTMIWNVDLTAGDTTCTGWMNAVGGFKDNGTAGIDATFTNGDGATVTVSGGIITSIV